ncbi:hypothetical protein QAD02_016188 [Eretmocerus hayati]|uniref:Uncharacterized protein n=1 Tax=Eretmocerus hayati TaxID=131215 RepID=A0ACC2PBN6_9HYME|nr:hypothetical protein QAD02_016188 [Eretmocerus hayati]
MHNLGTMAPNCNQDKIPRKRKILARDEDELADPQKIEIFVTPETTRFDVSEDEKIIPDQLGQSLEDNSEQQTGREMSLESVSTILILAERAIENVIAVDLIMTRTLRFKRGMERALEPYRQLHEQLLRESRQDNPPNPFDTTNGN